MSGDTIPIPAHKTCLILVTGIASALLLAAMLNAAVVPRFSAQQLVRRSQWVVLGTVGRSWTAWDSGHKYIWTHHELRITSVILGARSTSVVVSEPGGSLDGVTQQFSGAVPYSQGENAVVFLYRTPIGYWRTVGGPQGKFAVNREGRISATTEPGVSYAGPPAATGNRRQGAASSKQTASEIPLAALEGLNVAEFTIRIRKLAAPLHRSIQ